MEQLTPQEVFDKVAKHLLTQKEKSMDLARESCMYRGKYGMKCAIGCLIPDDVYDSGFEGLDVESLFIHYEDRNFPFLDINEEFLSKLQAVHDQYEVEHWKSELKEIAETFMLKCDEKVFGDA